MLHETLLISHPSAAYRCESGTAAGHQTQMITRCNTVWLSGLSISDCIERVHGPCWLLGTGLQMTWCHEHATIAVARVAGTPAWAESTSGPAVAHHRQIMWLCHSNSSSVCTGHLFSLGLCVFSGDIIDM